MESTRPEEAGCMHAHYCCFLMLPIIHLFRALRFPSRLAFASPFCSVLLLIICCYLFPLLLRFSLPPLFFVLLAQVYPNGYEVGSNCCVGISMEYSRAPKPFPPPVSVLISRRFSSFFLPCPSNCFLLFCPVSFPLFSFSVSQEAHNQVSIPTAIQGG